MNKKSSIKASIKSQRLVLQALYQWHVNRQNTNSIEEQFREEHINSKIDWSEFRSLFSGVVSMSDALDKELEPLLDRKLAGLDPVELSILRLGSYELHERLDIPYEVIINKSIELAHSFGANESYRFINAILDRLCSSLPLRKAEKESRKK